jgi:hypothetical protein
MVLRLAAVPVLRLGVVLWLLCAVSAAPLLANPGAMPDASAAPVAITQAEHWQEAVTWEGRLSTPEADCINDGLVLAPWGIYPASTRGVVVWCVATEVYPKLGPAPWELWTPVTEGTADGYCQVWHGTSQVQKCSAASRVIVEAPVYDELVAKLKEKTEALVIGDPTDKATYLGPVINKSSYTDFKNFNEDISGSGGKFLTGGNVKSGGMYNKGFFCEPTLVTDLPFSHNLWQQEMFLPITTIGKVKNLDEAMKIANNVNYGLTAGFYGSQKEADWFFDNIEAGVTYANRPQGATTGAWPGFQPFGGWKGSGSSGKNGGGYYYVQLYMHEQIQTMIKKKVAPKKAAKKKVRK